MRINPIHIFLNECLYIINARISIELTFLKELMLIKQVHQKCVIFLTIGISKRNVCHRCHDLLISMNLSDIAILNIRSADQHCIISRISKNNAINVMQHADLTKKSLTL